MGALVGERLGHTQVQVHVVSIGARCLWSWTPSGTEPHVQCPVHGFSQSMPAYAQKKGQALLANDPAQELVDALLPAGLRRGLQHLGLSTM